MENAKGKDKKERTRKLLAAFVPSVVTGVAVGVCGVSGCTRSTDTTPTSSAAFSEADIDSAGKAVQGVLPKESDDNSDWMTRDDLVKKLPTLKSALIDQALDSLRKERQILVFDDSGTLRYAKPESHRP